MEQVQDWMRKLDLDVLPEQHRKLAEQIGLDAMLELVCAYSGNYMYVPKFDALTRVARDKQMLKEYYSGTTPTELSHRYNLSVVQVYNIINAAAKESQRNQMTIDDLGDLGAIRSG